MGNTKNGANVQGAESARKGQIRNSEGVILATHLLPIEKATIRVTMQRRFESIGKGDDRKENTNGLTIIDANDLDGMPFATLFVNMKVSEHRAVRMLQLDNATTVIYDKESEVNAPIADIQFVDYDKNSGYEYFDGENWQPLRGIQLLQAIEHIDNRKPYQRFEDAFGVAFDGSIEWHLKAIQQFM